MMKPNIQKAKRHLQRIDQITMQRKALTPQREHAIIEKIRKDRETIWGEKFAAHS